MKKQATSLLLLVSGFCSCTAYAFDPLTISVAVSAGANLVNTISQGAGELSSTASAFTELYQEIDTEAQISEEGRKLIAEIDDLNSIAQEVGYTNEELQALGMTPRSEFEKLAGTLRTLTRAVRAAKQASRLVLRLQQKAQLSQVESTQIQRESLALQYNQIRLQHEAALQDVKKELLDAKEKRDQIKGLRKDLEQKGARELGRSGLLSFPKQTDVIETGIKISEKMRIPLISLIPLVIFLRIILNQIGFRSSSAYGNLIQNAIVCCFLLAFYPDLVRLCVDQSRKLGEIYGSIDLHEIKPGKLDIPVISNMGTKVSLVLAWTYEWIRYLIFMLADFIANNALGFMVGVFPLVIFLSQMFELGWILKGFLVGFILIAMWPLFWNLVGFISNSYWKSHDKGISDYLSGVICSVLQFVAPLIGMRLVQGHGIGQAVSAGVRSATSPANSVTSSGIRNVRSFFSTAIGGSSGGQRYGSYKKGVIGSTAGWFVNQGLSRTANAYRSSKSSIGSFQNRSLLQPEGVYPRIKPLIEGEKDL